MIPAVSPLRFLAATASPEAASVVVLGLPFDGTASFRAGSALGPDAVRAASASIETFSPSTGRDLTGLAIADAGNVEVVAGHDSVEEALARIGRAAGAVLDGDRLLLGIGGEHLVTLPCAIEARRRHPDLAAVVLDAHLDLRDAYGSQRLSHATVSRRLLDAMGEGSLAIAGARSGTREEFSLARERGLLHESSPEGLERLARWVAGRPLYLSIDLDVLDPAELPGTGCPEAGGLRYADLIHAIRVLAAGRAVAVDLTELAPPWDPSGRSAVLAAKLAREAILAFRS